ncbi:MAG TPA: hypothetical protein DCR53_13240, partial [Afipia sp.]|nr:hypothetical protein [Afipia sp.]
MRRGVDCTVGLNGKGVMRGISRFFGVAVVLAFAAMALPLHAQTPPPTQGQQSRIALVIGNGNYQKAPLATAAKE